MFITWKQMQTGLWGASVVVLYLVALCAALSYAFLVMLMSGFWGGLSMTDCILLCTFLSMYTFSAVAVHLGIVAIGKNPSKTILFQYFLKTFSIDANKEMGRCGSGGGAGQWIDCWLLQSYLCPQVALGNVLNPELLLMHLLEFECEWMLKNAWA